MIDDSIMEFNRSRKKSEKLPNGPVLILSQIARLIGLLAYETAEED
jgi:hypothetical protein